MELEDVAFKRARASGGDGGGSPGGGGVPKPDRLSALPDCLIHTIMSLLKARQAVQTCVLSTRWRHLWRSVPCLDVDHDEFRTVATAPSTSLAAEPELDPDVLIYEESDDSTDDDKVVNDQQWMDFEDFAESLMHRCNIAQLDTFRLYVDRGRAPRFADKLAAGGWFRRAMKYWRCNQDSHPPHHGSGGSWHMKRLYLCNVALDNHFGNHLTSVCLSLENLELEDCTCDEVRAIISHSLKRLLLIDCRFRALSEITCPALERLVISGGTNTSDVLAIVAPQIAHFGLDVPLRFARSISINQKPALSGP